MVKLNLTATGLSVGGLKVHYAWVIVGVAAMMWLVNSSIRSASSVLVPYFADPDKFGWSYAAIAVAVAIQWTVSGLLSPLAGWLGDRYGVRRMMVVGALLFLAGMVLTGMMSHLWEFYLYYGLLLGASIAIFQVPLVAAVTVWFRKHLGVAMGILQASTGLGSALLIFLIAVLVSHYGLKGAFWVPGIVGGVILLLLVKFFYNEPAEVGLRPLGAPLAEPLRRPQTGLTARVRTRVFIRQAQRTPAFWNLVGIHFWGCLGHNIVAVFLVAIARDEGVSPGLAAGLVIALTGVGTVFRFLVPVLADQLGGKRIMTVCFALQTFPILLLFVAQDLWVFYLFSVLYGIGMAGENTAFPVINRQYYGTAPQGTLYGWQVLGGGIGMALGPLAGGFLGDVTGSYSSALVLSFVTSLAGLVSILVLPNTARSLLPHWEESLPPEARSTARP